MDDEPLLTSREVCELLGVGRNTVTRYGKVGLLTRVVRQEQPRRVGYRLSEVEARQKELDRG